MMSDEDTTKTDPTPVAEPDNLVTPAAGDEAEAQPLAGGKLQADPLSDGTVPTVLDPGAGISAGVVAKGRASLTSVYQRADIITTLVTFVVAIIAAGLVLGGYLYLTQTNKKTVVTAPKVTTLDQKDLEKLGTFFGGAGGGAAGSAAGWARITGSRSRGGIAGRVLTMGACACGGGSARSRGAPCTG